MKKIIKLIFVTVVISLYALSTKAQGIYIKIGGGYGLPAGTSSFQNSERNNVTQTNKYDAVNYSFGKGINFAATFGDMFNKNFGAELNIGYLLGGTTEFTDNTIDVSATDEIKEKINSNMIFFTPALVIESGFEKINPYARIGLIIGIAKGFSEYDHTYDLAGSTNSSVEKTEYKMDIGLGANAALGVMYNISESFAIFGECNINSLSITPKSSEITVSTLNGTDQLNSMSISEKKTDYLSSYSYDQNSTPSTSEPRKEIKTKMPFSSIGANIGVKISFK